MIVKVTLSNDLGGPKVWHGNFIKIVQRKFDES